MSAGLLSLATLLAWRQVTHSLWVTVESTQACVLYSRTREKFTLCTRGRRQEDKLDSKADYPRVYIHTEWVIYWAITKCMSKYDYACMSNVLTDCHDSTILFSLLCLPFSFLFTLLWVTWLYLVMGHMFSHMMGHLTCHMTRAHDQSHDHGLFLLRTWVTMTLYFVFHLFLAYDSLYLISDSSGCFRLFIGHTDSYCHIILTVWCHWRRVLYYS